MSPESKLYGRLAIGAARTSLGHAPMNVILIRAAEEIKKAKHREDMLITLEMSPSRLPDSTLFDKTSVMEQQLAANISTDMDAESPFPGITIGRVAEVMMTPEYNAYEAICDPLKRQGLSQSDIDRITQEYHAVARDCFEHFPKWIP